MEEQLRDGVARVVGERDLATAVAAECERGNLGEGARVLRTVRGQLDELGEAITAAALGEGDAQAGGPVVGSLRMFDGAARAAEQEDGHDDQRDSHARAS